jgi:MFS transporter, DHA1 family, inner membrane transport protein
VLAAGAFAVGIDAVIVSGLLAGIKSSFGVSSGAAGQLITVFGLGYAVLAPTLAPVTARRSRRLVLAGGLCVFAAANALAALAPGFGLLLAARLLASAGAAIYTPAALAQASALAPPGRRGRSMAIVLSGATLSAVAGVPAGLLIAATLGWRAAFAVIAGGSAVTGCILVLIAPAARGQAGPAASVRTILADRQVLRVAAVTLLAYLAEFVVYSYLGLALIRLTHLSAHGLPAYYLLFGAAGVAGNIAGGLASDRWTAPAAANAALVLITLSVLAFPALLPSAGLVTAPLAGCGFAAWMLSVPQQHRMLSSRPDAAATVLGVNQSALYLGLSLSGVTGALLLPLTGLADLGYAAAAIALAALAVSATSPGWPARPTPP